MSENKQTGITVKIIGENSNIFKLLGIAKCELKRHGMPDVAKQLIAEVMASRSYEEALYYLRLYNSGIARTKHPTVKSRFAVV